MKIYNYHPITSEFLSQTLADPDPKSAKNFLIPAHATALQPPVKRDGYALVFDGDKWIHKVDNRGKSYWNEKGEHVSVSELGIDIPIGSFSEKPDLRTETEKQADFSASVKLEVSNRIFAHASRNTQMNMTGAATAGLLTPDQMDAYKEGLLWVSSIRSKGAELIASGTEDYSDDKHWPEPSAAAVALANAF